MLLCASRSSGNIHTFSFYILVKNGYRNIFLIQCIILKYRCQYHIIVQLQLICHIQNPFSLYTNTFRWNIQQH